MKTVTKLTTQTVHVCKDDYYTLCGKQYEDNVVNRAVKLRFGFPREKGTEKVNCKKCLQIYDSF